MRPLLPTEVADTLPFAFASSVGTRQRAALTSVFATRGGLLGLTISTTSGDVVVQARAHAAGYTVLSHNARALGVYDCSEHKPVVAHLTSWLRNPANQAQLAQFAARAHSRNSNHAHLVAALVTHAVAHLAPHTQLALAMIESGYTGTVTDLAAAIAAAHTDQDMS